MRFNYKKMRIRTIFKFIITLILAFVPLYVILRDIKYGDFKNVSIILPVARMTIMLIGECLIIYKLFTYLRIITSEEKAHNYYINKRDERNQYITGKILGQTTFVTVLFEILGVIICSYISLEGLMAFLSLIIIQLVVLIISTIHFTDKN